MKQIIIILLACFVWTACKEEPHLKHKLAFTKTADECASGVWDYKLVSNTNGERYEFNACLAANYNGSYTLNRRADTLVLTLPADTSQNTSALYKLVLDVDSWPAYSHIYLGAQLLKLGKQ